MFARNPLTRILSAYNNKMSPKSTDDHHRKQFWKVGKSIIKTYRPWSLAAKKPSFKYYDLTFYDFVRFLADQKTNKSKEDNHWIENYRFCRPCDVSYDVIGKYETLMEDAKYILKLTHVDKIVSFPQTEGPNGTSTFSSTPEKLWSFYKQIPMSDIAKLVERYKLDFLLFNYTYPSNDLLSQWLKTDWSLFFMMTIIIMVMNNLQSTISIQNSLFRGAEHNIEFLKMINAVTYT